MLSCHVTKLRYVGKVLSHLKSSIVGTFSFQKKFVTHNKITFIMLSLFIVSHIFTNKYDNILIPISMIVEYPQNPRCLFNKL